MWIHDFIPYGAIANTRARANPKGSAKGETDRHESPYDAFRRRGVNSFVNKAGRPALHEKRQALVAMKRRVRQGGTG